MKTVEIVITIKTGEQHKCLVAVKQIGIKMLKWPKLPINKLTKTFEPSKSSKRAIQCDRKRQNIENDLWKIIPNVKVD